MIFLEDATIYDIESEQSDKKEKLSNIPKRVRFYHSKIDAGALKSEENAQSDTLKEIHRMVNAVKRDEEVSIEYMKIFEREQMIREEGREEGRQEEKANTERERRRADAAEAEVELLKRQIERLKNQK